MILELKPMGKPSTSKDRKFWTEPRLCIVLGLKPMGKPSTSKDCKFWTEPRPCMVLGLKPMGKPTTVNPKVLVELFSMYRDWQEQKTQMISKKQEEIENKIDVADALAVKLLQRFNFSVSAMKTASQHLSEVHALQVDIGELKGRLTEVISNCDALCKRIASEGPESLRSSVKPFTIATADSEISSTSSSLPRDLNKTVAKLE
uniref:Uncharacterized protein n=1 Tax=Quercus lobata TaxID=97700 RepID=A0A7N2LYT9_QUELO